MTAIEGRCGHNRAEEEKRKMRRFKTFLGISMSVLLLTACGAAAQGDYDAVCGERDSLRQEKEELQAQVQLLQEELEKLKTEMAAEQAEDMTAASTAEETVQVCIGGTIAVKVLQVIPGYMLDDWTLTDAVVACYLSSPFVVYLGEELAGEAEPGGIYVLEFEEKQIEMTGAEYRRGIPEVEAAIPLYNLRVTSLRPAKDGDYGVDGIQLYFQRVD